MNNEMRRERALQLMREAEALRDKAGKVSTPLTEADALCAKAKELDALAERLVNAPSHLAPAERRAHERIAQKRTSSKVEPGARAKRGELIVIPVTRSFTYAHGARFEHDAYLVQRVTSVRRDGTAQARESLLTGTTSKGVVVGQMIAKGVDVERATRAIVERGSDEFDSVESVRAFLKPFLE